MKKLFTILIVLIIGLAASNSFGQGVMDIRDRLEKVEKQLDWYKSELAKLQKQLQNQPEASSADMTIYDESLFEMAARLTELEKELRFATQKQSTMYADLNGAFTTLDNKVETARIGGNNWAQNPPDIKRGEIVFGGFVQQHYYNEGGDTPQSTFISKRMRLILKGNINQYAAIVFQGEFANSPKLLDAALTLTPVKNLSFRVGQFKPPFGTDYLKSPTVNPFVNYSKTSGIGTGYDAGMAITYKAKFNKNFDIKLTSGVFNGAGLNTTDVNSDKNVVARAEINLISMLTLTSNFLVGKTNEIGIAKENKNCYGGSLAWNWKNETFEGEYSYSKTGETKKSGWYIMGGHTFNFDSKFLPALQFVTRYENYDADHTILNDKVNRITIGTNLYIDKKYTLLQLNYQINGEEGASVDNNEFLINFQAAF